MYGIGIFFAALILGPTLGRWAYLIFRDVRLALPWLFGGDEDSGSDQIRILTASAVATIADSMWAVFSGHSALGTLIFTPFAFVWVWEGLHTVQRFFGPVIERFVVEFDPVNIGYVFMKDVLVRMSKSRGQEADVIEGRERDGGGERADERDER
jgi:hypothetical protein